jgi:hypothetical protein
VTGKSIPAAVSKQRRMAVATNPFDRRFPYAVYYRVEREVARVRAVLDCRRDPYWIAKQLK